MRENNRNSIASIGKLPQFTTMNVIDGQAGLVIYSSLIFYSLTIDNILNIIIILILAGVTISTLMGENGLINRAISAKEKTEIAQIEEEANLAYLDATINEYEGATTDKLLSVINELTKQGYTIEQVNASGASIIGVNLSESEIAVEKDGTETVTIELLTESGGETQYYALINNEYYEIKLSSDGVEVSKTPSEIEPTPSNTIEVSTSDETIATASVEGTTITITGIAKGTTNISVTVNGTEYSNIAKVSTKELANLASINVTTLTLDGASLITATLSDGTIATSDDVKWTSSNPSVATVTSNGIVKCSTNTGTATITCTGANGVSLECQVTSTDARIVDTNTGTANRTITGSSTDKAYNNPIIPVGFSAIDTISAKWDKEASTQDDYDKGLVIMDAKGNQFVWVPIDGTTVTYAKWCTTNMSHSSCSDDTFPATDTSTTYGGFWIGRYEAGLDVDMGSTVQTTASKENRDKPGTPIIVEGASPWNYISYTNSQANANSMYINDYVQSGLVNGTQWDTTLKFLKSVGDFEVGDSGTSERWGNYNTSTIASLNRYGYLSTTYGASWTTATATTPGQSQLLRVGASTATKALNISDIAGNLWEWTNEIRSDNRVCRGGGYGESNSANVRASYRGGYSGSLTGSYLGFRVVLYVM